MAYRTIAVVPIYPPDESPRDKLLRENREKQERLNERMKSQKLREILAICIITLFPCLGVLGIGFEWNNMSLPLDIMSLVALGIASIGVYPLTSLALNVFHENK